MAKTSTCWALHVRQVRKDCASRDPVDGRKGDLDGGRGVQILVAMATSTNTRWAAWARRQTVRDRRRQRDPPHADRPQLFAETMQVSLCSAHDFQREAHAQQLHQRPFVSQPRLGGRMERQRPGLFTGLMAQQSRKYMGSAAPTAASRPTRSPGWSRARCSCTATSPTWWCRPTSTRCPSIQFAVDQLRWSTSWWSATTAAAACWRRCRKSRVGLADNWIRHVKDVCDRCRHLLDA